MRYFFDIFEGDHWARDDFGVDCRDDRAARYQAVLQLAEMARDILPADGAARRFEIAVRTSDGEAFRVSLEFAAIAGPSLHDKSMVPDKFDEPILTPKDGTSYQRQS